MILQTSVSCVHGSHQCCKFSRASQIRALLQFLFRRECFSEFTNVTSSLPPTVSHNAFLLCLCREAPEEQQVWIIELGWLKVGVHLFCFLNWDESRLRSPRLRGFDGWSHPDRSYEHVKYGGVVDVKPTICLMDEGRAEMEGPRLFGQARRECGPPARQPRWLMATNNQRHQPPIAKLWGFLCSRRWRRGRKANQCQAGLHSSGPSIEAAGAQVHESRSWGWILKSLQRVNKFGPHMRWGISPPSSPPQSSKWCYYEGIDFPSDVQTKDCRSHRSSKSNQGTGDSFEADSPSKKKAANTEKTTSLLLRGLAQTYFVTLLQLRMNEINTI